MKILQFVQSMLHRFDKKTLDEDLDRLRKELRDTTLPPYESASKFMKNWEFGDAELKKFDTNFVRQIDSRFKGNSIEVTYEILNRAMENIATLEKLVDKYYSNDIARSAMTFNKAILLQYIEAVSFASKYARKHLINVLTIEVGVLRDNKMVGNELTKAEMYWLINHRPMFITTLKALDIPARDLAKDMESIPDIAINTEDDSTGAVIAAVGKRKLDPFGLGFIGVAMNPIYHIRMMVVEYQVAQYESAKEEKLMLEYQIRDLENSKAGKNDPKIEKAIEYTRDRIQKLDYKIAKLEEGDE